MSEEVFSPLGSFIIQTLHNILTLYFRDVKFLISLSWELGKCVQLIQGNRKSPIR